MGGTVSRGGRPAGKLAAARVWALPVIWLWHREPERPQVVVVYVDAATGIVMGAAQRAVVAGKAVRALPPGP
jgi:hypothetical protein